MSSEIARLAYRVAALERQLARTTRTARLAYSSIEDGAVEVYDGDGALRGSIGLQDDGTAAFVTHNGPPPPTPTTPVVEPALAGVTVTWPGTWSDAENAPFDLAEVQVHLSVTADAEPDPGNPTASFHTAAGGTLTVATGTYAPVWIRLIAVSTSGTAGAASAAVQGQARKAVPDDLVDAIIDETKLVRGAVTSITLADGAVLSEKLAANAVTVGKLADGAVTLTSLGGALADSTAQRLVDAMGDAAAWQVTDQGTGTTWRHLSGITDAPTGQTVGEAGGFVRLRGTTLIPYEPGVLYRLSARVRATAQLASGADSMYVGVLGIGTDGTTLVNRLGVNSANSHYYAAASALPVPASSGWITVVGYLKGRAASGSSGSAGPNSDPRQPGTVHDAVRYITPYLWLNYQSMGASSSTSVMQVDAVSIEALKTGVVDSTNLVSGSVTAAAIAADAVTAGKVAADAVTGREIAAGSVTAAQLAAGSVAAEKITAGAVTAEKIGALAVTTEKLNTLAVTTDKIAANAVTATAIAAGAIEATHIKAGVITADKLDADAINGRVITGSTLRTAADGQRVVISPGGGTPDVASVKFYSGSTNEAAPAALNTAIAYSTDASGTYELPSLALTAPRVSGTSQDSGLFVRGHIPGYSGGLFNVYANQLGGNGVAYITGHGADTSAQGSFVILHVRDAPAGSAASSAKLTSSGFTVDGTLKAGNIATGRVTITPSAANTPTSVTVTGLSLTGTTFRAVATASTNVPGTAVTGVGVTNVTATGLTVWLTRTNTTSTAVDWIVIGS